MTGLSTNILGDGSLYDPVTIALRRNCAGSTAIEIRCDDSGLVLLFSVPIVLDDLDFESQLIPLPKSESDAK